MHELSLAMSIVETVTESLAAYPGASVKEVRLRVGALAAVEELSPRAINSALIMSTVL